ncbi:hypothetical protein DMENIID0001_155270 [Sergentomyia squamirostris]
MTLKSPPFPLVPTPSQSSPLAPVCAHSDPSSRANERERVGFSRTQGHSSPPAPPTSLGTQSSFIAHFTPERTFVKFKAIASMRKRQPTPTAHSPIVERSLNIELRVNERARWQ